MFKKILSFIFGTPKKVEVEEKNISTSSNIIIPDAQMNLKVAVDEARFKDMEKQLSVTNMLLSKVLSEIQKSQELTVHQSTLHEELLNLLDQGNVGIIRLVHGEPGDQHPQPRDNADFDLKKKSDMN